MTTTRRRRCIRLPVIRGDGTATVELTKGLFAVIDEADVEAVSRFTWCVTQKRNGKCYATSAQARTATGYEFMHAYLLQTPLGMMSDHIDGNGLNNRRSNLRVCSRSQNTVNSRPTGRHSRFKGVSWVDRKRRPWRAQIMVNGRSCFLGSFATEEEAARAYDRVARPLFGLFAWLNFPGEECA